MCEHDTMCLYKRLRKWEAESIHTGLGWPQRKRIKSDRYQVKEMSQFTDLRE